LIDFVELGCYIYTHTHTHTHTHVRTRAQRGGGREKIILLKF